MLSLAFDLSTGKSAKNANPIVHLMTYERHQPISALDFMGVSPHGFAITHLDAVGHVSWEGHAYNGRSAAEITTQSGMTFGSVCAQKRGIFTRGVLLDVAAAQGRDWLTPDSYVTIDDLEAAEKLAGVEVGSGDAIFVRIGLEEREAAQGPEDSTVRAGLHAECLEWLWEREVAVYSGDCVRADALPE